jgi:hypothetical protein
MEIMPGTRIKFAVTMTNQRKYRRKRLRMMRERVMAKATLDQAVARVVMAVSVF